LIDRRTFLIKALAAAGTAGAAVAAGCLRRPGASPLKAATQYLWSRQGEDGGFRSTTYGLLRSGQSLTPFVLLALLGVPEGESSPKPGAIGRALEFIKANTNADGALGLMDDTPDYPNYATALAVSAIVKARKPGYETLIEQMVAQLRAQQFSEANGWSPQDAPYGAWGMGGTIHRPPEPGHVDLSMTRHVLEALHLSGVSVTDPAIARALVYLRGSQNPDGGFYFSAVNPEINKAGNNGGGFASYSTATADGVLALRAAGVDDEDPRIKKAIAWLVQHHQPDRAPGFEETGQKWAGGLRFYYAHAISRVLPQLPVELPDQGEDGSFRNQVNLVKEDDPLIATAFALYVMARSPGR